MVTDQQRKDLEKVILASLLLISLGAADEAATALGTTAEPQDQDVIRAKAAEVALLVQAGINTQLSPPEDSVYVDRSTSDRLAAIRAYNDETLIPYLASWAQHQGRIEVYLDTPAGDGSGRSARDAKPDGSPRLWTWEQNTDFEDDCAQATGMSPAPYDDLIATAGGAPPVHRNCACDLYPEDWPD